MCEHQHPYLTHLRFSNETINNLINHLKTKCAQERVGALIGSGDRVVTAIRMDNSLPDHGVFRIEAYDVVRVAKYANRINQSILGLYHEHPGGDLQLSINDRRSLIESPWPWVILNWDGSYLHARAYLPKTCEPFRVVFE